MSTAFLVILELFVALPVLIYSGNLGEFSTSLPHIMMRLAGPFVLSFVFLATIGLVLRGASHQMFVVMVAALGTLIWLQANFLIGDYGVLDGSMIAWADHRWQMVRDAALWGGLCLSAGVFFRRLYPLAVRFSVLLIVFQMVSSVVGTIRHPSIWSDRDATERTPLAMLREFSSDQNVIHLVLDQFGSIQFRELLRARPDLAAAFDGFTFFPDTTSSTAVTYLSVPSFLSAKVFTNTVPVAEFLKQNYEGGNLHSHLARNGFDIDVATHNWFLAKRDFDTAYYKIPTPYLPDTATYSSAFLFDVGLFRASPDFLKPVVYNRQTWLFSRAMTRGLAAPFQHISGLSFLRDLAETCKIARARPVYKYLHINSPHPPLVTDKNLQYAGEGLPFTAENMLRQAESSLQSVVCLLDGLKDAGVFDSSLILIHSDHGSGVRLDIEENGRPNAGAERGAMPDGDEALPLLLIKPPRSRGAIKVSTVQGELGDLPATICALLKVDSPFPGRSLFEVSPHENRARRFLFSTKTHRDDAMVSGYFDELIEYRIDGPAMNPGSWKKVTVRQNKLNAYSWDQPLAFNDQGDIRPFLVSGWSLPEPEHIWSAQNTAVLRLPIQRPEANSIEMAIEFVPFLAPAAKIVQQRIGVDINATPVGEWVFANEGAQNLTVRFPSTLIGPESEMVVTFHFPDAVAPKDLGLSADERILAFAFRSLVLTPRD